MAPRNKRRALAVAMAIGCAIAAYRRKKAQDRSLRDAASAAAAQRSPGTPVGLKKQSTTSESARRKGTGIDRVFLQRIAKLLPILVPGPFCKEAFYLALVAGLMIIRTLCDVWQIRNGTSIESSIITRDAKGFRKYIIRFAAAMLPIALVNNMLRYGLNEIALCFRARLSRHLYKEYLKDFTYYKLSNLDNRISDPDQLLTQDIDKFSNCLADLYSNVSKPVLDISIYAYKLAENVGGLWAPGAMLAYLAASGVLLTHLRRPLGQYTVKEQRLEGHFRQVTQRIITNSEEVAFYRGDAREAYWVERSFRNLERHVRRVMQFRFSVGMIDTVVAKYLATIVGYHIVSRPLLDMTNPRLIGMSAPQMQEEYYRSGRMMLQMAQAVGRLVLAGRELTRLAGFTARVDDLTKVLSDLQANKYQRTLIKSNSRRNLRRSDRNGSSSTSGDEWGDNEPVLLPGAGVVREEDGVIRFEKVPIVTPNREVLVDSLSMEVKRGMNTLICGPNGCGKSSLFRILGDLWPVFGGTVSKPQASKIFYVPQKPYLCLGTLRDQVLYPHDSEEMRASGRRDEDILHLLAKVNLEYLEQQREAGLEAEEDWADVLSGGEKQKLAMARLFYHRPQFAILDECTSAVSVDAEGSLYEECKAQGITLLSVSHRKSLWQYHEYVLRFDGEGGAKFLPIAQVPEFGS